MKFKAKCDGATVYMLNANGVNLWSFSVQAGKDDRGGRTSDAEIDCIARIACAALNKELEEATQ